jgi:rRNA maturation protein Nop10
MLTGYETVNRNPGWLFRPDDRYDPYRITIYPR